MMEIVGFVTINKKATTCRGAENPDEFIGNDCAVMEFATDGGALVFNPQGSALAMFDKEDIMRRFECGYLHGIVTPPGLNILDQTGYVLKCQTRTGGYSSILRDMVIQASLSKGVFCDLFLWEKQ